MLCNRWRFRKSSVPEGDCMRRSVSNVILSVLTFLILSSNLSAHPMGNFSINHYARIQASPAGISVHAVLDFAEIPTFQLFSDWVLPADAEITPAAIQRMVEKLVAELKPQLRLLVDGA